MEAVPEAKIARDAIEAFFDRFVDAFATFDAREVAELFATPAIAFRKDGTLVLLATKGDVIRYYGAALEGYRQSGCTSCVWGDLQTMPMGALSVATAVSWRLLRSDGSVAAAWRQTYSLAITDDGLKNFAAVTHTG